MTDAPGTKGLPTPDEGGRDIRESNILAAEPRAPEYARLLNAHDGAQGARLAGVCWDALNTVKELELRLAEAKRVAHLAFHVLPYYPAADDVHQATLRAAIEEFDRA